jgi:predicted aspartyl protease
MGSDPTKVSMGTTYLTARIRRLDKQGAGYTDKFLVDSGATETMVDGDRLRSIGIEPEDELDIELADGSLHTYPMGSARIAVFDGLFGPGGKEITNPVLFGPSGIEPILGITVLESLGLVIDPRQERVLRRRAVLMKGAASAAKSGARFRLRNLSQAT